MSQAISHNFSNNQLGNNISIHQGDVHNHASDQANQCLKDLRSTDPRHDKTRIQNTKGGLLKDSYRWILENESFKDWRDNAQNRILWIKGDPGKGKTMLLCGIIDELMPMTKLAKPIDQTTNTILLSYFFCQGTDARINNASAVLRGLIYLLIIQEPSLISHVQTKYEHAGKDLFSDANAWVALSDIFLAMLQDSKAKEIILIIDALDECETDLPKLLDAVIQQLAHLHVKFIISSRNILSIRQRLEPHISQGILSLELKGNASSVSEAVDAFIKHKVSRLYSIQDDQDLQVELRKTIQQKANGTFLWVSLVMKELGEAQSWEMMDVVEEMPMDLTALYRRMLNDIHSLKSRYNELCRNILSATFTAYYPLSLAEIGVLSGLPDQVTKNFESIAKVVLMCGSFLTLNEDKVYFIHQSAKDFLTTEIFSTDIAQRHANIFKRSVAAISKLPKNIYRLTDFGPRPKDAQLPSPDPLASMRYSCFYWANHLCNTYGANTKDEAEASISETLEPFLHSYVLRWIESLCLLDGLLEGLRSIRKLLRKIPRNDSTHLSSILSSIEIFILRNGAVISKAPLQVYGSALLFSPVHGHIKATHWNERLFFIKAIQGIKEEAFLKTLEGHTSKVIALAFSSDGETLASMSGDKTLRGWDIATGTLKWTIQCQSRSFMTHSVTAIAFSPDNRTLLLATHRQPMLRGVSEESEEEEAESDGYWITYITLSPTNGLPEADRGNRTVQLNELSVINEHDDWVSAFAFSSDCKTLASGLISGSIWVWDATTGLLRQIMEGLNEWIEAIAFSSDGSKIASKAWKKLQLWDAATGALIGKLKVGEAKSISFCQNDKNLLCGRILHDLTTGAIAHTSTQLYDPVTASPDNKIIASAGSEVQLWDATIIQWQSESAPSARQFSTFAFSVDGTIVACARLNVVQIWDTAAGECCRTIEDCWPDDEAWQLNMKENYDFEYTAIAFSADGKVLALGSRLISDDMNVILCQIQIWDTVTWECTWRKTLDDECCTLLAVAFSPDGNKLVLGDECEKIMLFDILTGTCLWETKTQRTSSDGPECIAFSPDSSVIASAHYERSRMMRSRDDTIDIGLWDAATGSHRQTFAVDVPGTKMCSSIMFSPDGRRLYIDHQYELRLFQEGQDEDEDEDEDEYKGIIKLDAYLSKDLSKDMQGRGTLVTDGWITKNGRRLLWIPQEYRHRIQSAFLCGNTAVLGHESGLTFVWLDL